MNLTKEELLLQSMLMNSANGPISAHKMKDFVALSILGVQLMTQERIKASQIQIKEEKIVAQPAPDLEPVIEEEDEGVIPDQEETPTLYQSLLTRLEKLGSAQEFDETEKQAIVDSISRGSNTPGPNGKPLLVQEEVDNLRLLYRATMLKLKKAGKIQMKPPEPPADAPIQPQVIDEPGYEHHFYTN